MANTQAPDKKGRIVVSNRVQKDRWEAITDIAKRRGEKIEDTLEKALYQYVMADARKRR